MQFLENNASRYASAQILDYKFTVKRERMLIMGHLHFAAHFGLISILLDIINNDASSIKAKDFADHSPLCWAADDTYARFG